MEIDVARLQYMQERVNGFLEHFRDSIAYDLDTQTPDAITARSVLDEMVLQYAQGVMDEKGIESAARAYVKQCKRPIAQPRQANEQPLTYKEQRSQSAGNYQSGYISQRLLKGARNIRQETKDACARMYFAGETPPEGATVRDCADGGSVPADTPPAKLEKMLERDKRLALLPKPVYVSKPRGALPAHVSKALEDEENAGLFGSLLTTE